MFENSSAILHHEHGNAALTFGIFCRVRAIRRPDFRIDRCRSYDESEEDNEQPATHDVIQKIVLAERRNQHAGCVRYPGERGLTGK
jgi:hypothetical protein